METLPPLLCPFFFFVLVILRTVGFRASSIWSISCAPPIFCFYVFAERRTKTMTYEGVVASSPPLFRSFPSVFSSISFLWCLCLSSCSLSVCLFFIVPCVFLLSFFYLVSSSVLREGGVMDDRAKLCFGSFPLGFGPTPLFSSGFGLCFVLLLRLCSGFLSVICPLFMLDFPSPVYAGFLFFSSFLPPLFLIFRPLFSPQNLSLRLPFTQLL